MDHIGDRLAKEQPDEYEGEEQMNEHGKKNQHEDVMVLDEEDDEDLSLEKDRGSSSS